MTVSQTSFRAALLDAEHPAPAGLTDGHGTPARKRFDVYRNNVAVSLTEALVTAFPSIHSLVGDDFFRAMAGVFLRQHPPSSPVMMYYGAEMPAFLADFAPVAHLPYLADVARIDLALRRAYHAADATAVDPSAFGAIAPEALGAVAFSLAPAVQIVSSPYPIHDIWQMTKGGSKPSAAAQDVLITRPEFDPVVDLLPPGGAIFFEQIGIGQTLGAAMETATGHVPDFDLGGLLGLALTRGALTDLTRPPAN
ncbi:DNA-binding domain-containing protein [Shimia ponticola]|uniref:HvfC/BufC N-terminal domain-containing protein n=1 Tax=Shimia ponticola TaxID=2582893 RepID=UPI0011BD87ED|nr:DNA-binding domain-containing protein [Shimia ponticola]